VPKIHRTDQWESFQTGVAAKPISRPLIGQSQSDSWIHKVHIHPEYHRICPIVRIETTHPQARVSPPGGGGGGTHSHAGDGVRRSPSGRLEKKPSTLSTLWLNPCLFCVGTMDTVQWECQHLTWSEEGNPIQAGQLTAREFHRMLINGVNALFFCRLHPKPPGQRLALTGLTLYRGCGLAYPYDWRGFVWVKKKTNVGLLV
jgi:hypothetical protein